MKKVIYLNAGHSFIEPGVIVKGIKEADLNISIRNALISELKRQEFKIKKIPDNLNLRQSIDWVNKNSKHIDDGLALSIHCNCCNGKGAEAFYFTGSRASKKIADDLINTYCKETKIKNRGSKPDSKARFGRLAWIRNTRIWAVLLECGFMDYPNDMEKLQQPDLIAQGICKGICKVYNEDYQEEYTKKLAKKLLERDRIEEIKKKIIQLVNQI